MIFDLFLKRESLEDKELRLKAGRLRELNNKVPTMEVENEKRILMGYPHLLEVVKERCPKCNGKMWHDNFEKVLDYSKNFSELKARYQCVDCKYDVLFSLITNKFDKEPF